MLTETRKSAEGVEKSSRLRFLLGGGAEGDALVVLGERGHEGRVRVGAVEESGILKIARDSADILLDIAFSSFGWARLRWCGRGRCRGARL